MSGALGGIGEAFADGIGAAAVGAAADRHGLEGPILTVAVLAFAPWGVAFWNRQRIAASFGGTASVPP